MKAINKLACAILLAGTAAGCLHSGNRERQSGWTVLFDGHSTEAWRGFRTTSFPSNSWVVVQGALKTVPGHELDLVTREQYKDFELEFDWRVTVGANSGIMFHVSEEGSDTWLTGPEMQIVDDDNSDDGKDPLTSAGALYDLVAPTKKKLNPADQWNKARIVVTAQHVEHWLNGVRIVEYQLGSPELNALIAKTKFKDMPRFGKNETGLIALQNHGGEVWFRNIRVRRL